ncbi:LacI family transcriptional regulator [Sphingomonas sp. PP-CE-3A-406]|uniref:LacI family DNA-binding transcriptional regulator n=1 Tax=Sphingomonas sp. PP-CE-3A-406 TaxID=2135659 RepID=UPI000EF868FD|nr:LacI family DNA-binding transcriptional regulator [Sphingomonas sp. PP-CE-3A-406]RMB54862.1 LacI family transcriptional regulator [Sphingomonas sp. PP-CE-3A-406]
MPYATVRDIAREAAVSVATVSRALNGHSNVRPEVRAHIESVATRLGYVPHAAARHLSSARSGMIGVVVPDLHGEFFSELLRGMDREASELGLYLMMMVMHGDAQRGVAALHAMRGRVDGLVVMAPQVSAGELLAHLPQGMPAILVNCAPGQVGRSELRIDNVAGATTLVEHLIAGGRRRLVHIAGPEGNIDAEERLRGARDACARAGLALHVLPGDFREPAGASAVATLLDDGTEFDAIFAANDMMAIGAMMALKRAGVAVPDQVAICGFDDVPLTRLISPSLTSASIDIASFGAGAVARLVKAIAGEDDGLIEHRVPVVVVRESTGPMLFNVHNKTPEQSGKGELR